MPVRSEPWPAGTPCWADLAVPDIDAAKRFYAAVLGWEFTDHGEDYGGYVTCTRNGSPAAALTPMYQPGMPVAWTTYFATDDLGRTLERVGAAGGTVVLPATQVMDLGSMAVALDPGGAAFAVWQSGSHPGFGLYRESGTVVWEQLVPGEGGVARARDFYGEVFDLSFADMDGGAMFSPPHGIDEQNVGGIGSPEDETAAPHWQLWFLVDDVDAAAAAAGANGGKVVRVPGKMPWGRDARLLDPAGAELHVLTPDRG